MTDIAVIILVGQEKIHMQRCMEKLAALAPRQVFFLESQEDDGCHQIALDTAAKLGWRVQEDDQSSAVHLQPSPTLSIAPHLSTTLSLVFHAWPGNQSEQFNWALDNLPIQGAWVLRLDADEYLSAELIKEIRAKLDGLPDDVSGVVLNLRRIFMGRVIRRGMPRIKMLRLFRVGKARCEQRIMDEHIELLEGRTVEFEWEFVDHNLNDIGWWTAKHNGYALREAVDLLDMEYGLLRDETGNWKLETGDRSTQKTLKREGMITEGGELGTEDGGREVLKCASSEVQKSKGLGQQAAAKRKQKRRYAKMPLFGRAFAYFCYRYIACGGFLEGKEGFLWHFLQGWWYRTLVDAKVWEIKRESGGDKKKMLELLRGKYGMKI